MPEEREWAAYFYPPGEAEPGIFINKLGIKDARLWQAERFLVARRAEQLYAGHADIPQTLDLEQYLAIHRYIGQDLYTWAGKVRDVSIGKILEDGEPARWFLPPASIEPWMEAVSETARSIEWEKLDRPAFVTEIAALHTELNFGHFSRELNGRTTRIFLHQVAARTEFTLDFDRVGKAEWDRASHLSRPTGRPGAEWRKNGPLDYEAGATVFEKIVTDRPAAAQPVPVLSAARFAQLDFPHPPRLDRSSPLNTAAYKPPAGREGDRHLGR